MFDLLFLALAAPLFAAPGPADIDEHEAWTLTAMNRLQEALDTYQGAHESFPVSGPGLVEVGALRSDLVPTYLDSVPLEDGWGTTMMYWSSGERYVLVSYGADRAPGGGYGAVPEVSETGDDLVVIDGRLARGPERIIRLMEGGAQKRTMADIRSLATCFEAYHLDNDAFPGAPTAGWVDVGTIVNLLQPIYIRTMPLVDAWGRPFTFWSDGERYRIVSAGRDGVPDADWTTAPATGETSGFDRDIVMGDGTFIQWPGDAVPGPN
jgi:hypothetical protein